MCERADERAVSEVVGFVLVFSLVVGTIALVYVTGFAGLTDTRDVEQVNNAERAFDVLADGFDKLARGEAPNRATEIKLADAQLTLGNLKQGAVTDSDGTMVAEIPQHRPIVYTAPSGSEVVYEHGAVIRVDDGGAATMRREPDFIIGEERTVIRHIETSNLQIGSQSVAGDTTVLVRSSATRSDLLYSAVENDEVTLALDTAEERASAWTEYMESEMPDGGTCSVSDPIDGEVSVECTFETETIYVSKTRIKVDFT